MPDTYKPTQTMELPSHLDRIGGVPPLEMIEDFDNALSEYNISGVMEDLLLVQYVDGDAKERISGGVIIQANVTTKMYRVGRILMTGPDCKMLKAGDYVIFPQNNPNVAGVKNVRVHGKDYKELLFVKESITFCKCEPVHK